MTTDEIGGASTGMTVTRPVRRVLLPVLAAVLVVFTAQQMLAPMLAPLSRELALTETQLGVIMSVAGIALTAACPLWGRALDTLGPRFVLLAGLALATVGLVGFAVIATFGLDRGTTPSTIFAALLVVRGVVFGVGFAAIPVAALGVAVTISTTDTERTKAMSLVGAAQSLSLVLGPATGGALAAVSLLLPLYVAPAVLILLMAWTAAFVTRAPAHAHRPKQTLDLKPWDLRIRLHLTIGFLLYLSLCLVQVIIGFLVADRLHLGPRDTASAVGIALFTAGLLLVTVQGVLVPKIGWPAQRLLQLGAPIAVAAYAALTVSGTLWSITASFGLLSIGLGLAIPGITAATTLAVDQRHHGVAAGLIAATTGAAFVVGSVLGTALYELGPTFPLVTSLGGGITVWILVWVGRPAAGYGSAVSTEHADENST